MISCKADIMSCRSTFIMNFPGASSQPFYYARHTPQNYSPALIRYIAGAGKGAGVTPTKGRNGSQTARQQILTS